MSIDQAQHGMQNIRRLEWRYLEQILSKGNTGSTRRVLIWKLGLRILGLILQIRAPALFSIQQFESNYRAEVNRNSWRELNLKHFQLYWSRLARADWSIWSETVTLRLIRLGDNLFLLSELATKRIVIARSTKWKRSCLARRVYGLTILLPRAGKYLLASNQSRNQQSRLSSGARFSCSVLKWPELEAYISVFVNSIDFS